MEAFKPPKGSVPGCLACRILVHRCIHALPVGDCGSRGCSLGAGLTAEVSTILPCLCLLCAAAFTISRSFQGKSTACEMH